MSAIIIDSTLSGVGAMQRRLGGIEVKSIHEGEGMIPMQLAVPGVTAEDLALLKRWYWSSELSLDAQAAVFRIEVRSYLLHVDGLNVLIDTCCGNDKQRSVPWAHQLQTKWLQNLAAAGCEPDDIHLVLCTHLHADHVGWNTRLKEGRWVPAFPNARYVMSRKEVELAGAKAHEPYTREAYADSVLPVIEAGQADLVENDHCVHREIEDGIWLQDASGHSPGSVVVNAQRRGSRAVFAGDIVHHPIQLVRPDIPFFADEDPVAACATRLSLLSQCAASDALLYPAHFPNPPAGRVRHAQQGFSYEFL
jgi:glyoxylase-like metal-dependent hydrolase (beta-lactamase superfamily II)